MTDPLTHPGQLCASGDRAVDLALELGQARARLARYEAQEARIRALADKWEWGALRWADPLPVPPVVGQLRAALDEPEAPP